MKKFYPSVSIIIRTKNEDHWIYQCISMIKKQTYKNYEIIVVDNQSTDRTKKIVKSLGIKLITIKNFSTGLALNKGISKSKGNIIVCLSAHCIPKNNNWLINLIKNFKNEKIAGVYGKQEPLSSTSDKDKRDLLITFGLDKKVQKKDPFFHNANSAIRKKIWNKVKFDEKVSNIEDRLWATEILNNGYYILYEPKAIVYHYHGIHHGDEKNRLKNTVKILENKFFKKSKFILNKKKSVFAVVPLNDDLTRYKNYEQLIYCTIEAIKSSKLVNKIVIASNNKKFIDIAKKYGFDYLINRDPDMSFDFISLDDVLISVSEKLKAKSLKPDYLMCLSIAFPFRKRYFLDDILKFAISGKFKKVQPVIRESKAIWKQSENYTFRLDEGSFPKKYKNKISIGLGGLCSIYHNKPIFESIHNTNTGLFIVDNDLSSIDARTTLGSIITKTLLTNWWNKEYK